MKPLALLAALLVVGLLAPRAALAQLSLIDALREADRSAYGNRAAAGRAAAQAAQTTAPLAGILPNIRIEAGFVRTTDPIGVFGSTLRQRTISQANFDPQRLNYPGAVGNYQGGLVVEQPILNADAWTGRRAARYAADATSSVAEWTRRSSRVDVVRAYYGVVLAEERAATLAAASRAATAHVSQAEAMVRQGMVTRSDALLASVRAGDIEAQLVEANAAVDISRRQLAMLLGRGAESYSDLSTRAALPSSERIRAAVAGDTLAFPAQPRADVDAASFGLAAAEADARRARSALLPRLNAFARYDWNSASHLYAGDRNWTAGVMATWTPVGAREISDVRTTEARAVTAAAEAEAAQANARLQLEQTRVALSVALARLTIAERAASQSAEAHRIVAKKYEGGLATIVELLDAQSVETQSALALSQARWAAITADADRLRALGRDPSSLAALDTTQGSVP